jgi:hypothetical protein
VADEPADNEEDFPDAFSEEDLLPEDVEQLAVPIPLDTLQPWHRPRKQAVRERQWFNRAAELVSYLKAHPNPTAGGLEVRYLTLAGIDYLDVRMLADLCAHEGVELTSTSFLAEEESNSVMARARVREEALVKAGYITDRSLTLPYKLEEIASWKSQAYREVAKGAPYHVVNVDACGSIALPSQDKGNRIIDAVHRLVELQLSKTMDPWLLYVTTDARTNTISQRLLNSFTEVIRANAAANDRFAREAPACIGEPEQALDDAIAAASSGGPGFLKFVVLGLSKWLLRNAQRRHWQVKVHDAYCYSTTPEGDNTASMASLVFEFLPPPPGLADAYGAVNITPAPGGPQEDYSVRALQKAQQMENLDRVLANDNGLFARLKAETRVLLQEVGYSTGALEALDRQGP